MFVGLGNTLHFVNKTSREAGKEGKDGGKDG